VHPDAAFVPGSTALTRGRDAIAAEWAGLIDGTGVVLRWYPQLVAIGGDPDTAVSQGPYWIEDQRPEAKQRFSMGRFSTAAARRRSRQPRRTSRISWLAWRRSARARPDRATAARRNRFVSERRKPRRKRSSRMELVPAPVGR
jgi:hypothetical protein